VRKLEIKNPQKRETSTQIGTVTTVIETVFTSIVSPFEHQLQIMLLSPSRRVITSLNATTRTRTNPFRNHTTTNKIITEQKEKPLTGYRKYAQQFKNKPGSYMTSFAILHEITAVVPFPFIYLALDASSAKIPFPENLVSEGNRFINKARVYYGYEPLEADSRVMMNLVTTYCIVKVSSISNEIGFVLTLKTCICIYIYRLYCRFVL
jgi:hypothetical protein